MNEFHQDGNKKRKNEKMRLQTDHEFQQAEIKNLNKKFNVDMFSTSVHGGKAFAAEQKIRELKNQIFWLKALEKKVNQKK